MFLSLSHARQIAVESLFLGMLLVLRSLVSLDFHLFTYLFIYTRLNNSPILTSALV